MALINHFHFLRPEWLWAIVPVILIIVLLAIRQSRFSSWHAVCDPHLLPALLVNPKNSRHFLPLFLLSIAWSLAVLAMAGPSFTLINQPIYQKSTATFFVLDLSTQMNATDLSPSRLTRARYKLLDLLQQNREGYVGLVVFTSEPYVVSPLTQDAKTIETMIPNLTPDIMPVQGQNVGHALELASKLLQQAGYNTGNIILLTAGPVSDSDLQQSTLLRKKGYTLSVLGMGKENGAPILQEQGHYLHDEQGAIVISRLDKKGLQQLANLGQGRYVDFTHTQEDINYLLEKNISHSSTEQIKVSKQYNQSWQDDGRWLIFLLLPLTLMGFRRGWFG